MNHTPKVTELIGKTVIIGITRLDHKEDLVDQRQYVGTFKSLEQSVHITLRNGEDFTLPPDLSVFQPAKPGIYRLRSTGDEVKDPDYTASWTVRAPSPKKKIGQRKKK